jgi:hypothetical protein
MTAAEWDSCADPVTMLDFLGGRASDRKLRLLACAAARSAAGIGSLGRLVDDAEEHAARMGMAEGMAEMEPGEEEKIRRRGFRLTGRNRGVEWERSGIERAGAL